MHINIDIVIILLTARPMGIHPVTKWKLFLKAQEGRTQYLKAGDVVEAIRSADAVIDPWRTTHRVVGEA